MHADSGGGGGGDNPAEGPLLWVGFAGGDLSVFCLADPDGGGGSGGKAAASWAAHGGGVNCLHGAHGAATVWSGGADWQA